jgi:ABC-type branched-subunit amino acid transport system substrate-binding protein
MYNVKAMAVGCLVSICTLLLVAEKLKADPTKVGLLLTLSGVHTEVGEDCKRGIDLARIFPLLVDLEKLKKLEFVTEDCRSEPRVALDAFRKLIDQDKVAAVITLRSPIGMTLNPVSRERRIPLVGAIGHPDFVPQNEFAFQTWPLVSSEGSVLAKYMYAEGLRTLAMISAEDDWTIALSKAVAEEFKRLGGQVIFDQYVLPTEVDLSSLMTKARKKSADGVFLNFTLGQGGFAAKKAKEYKVPGRYFSNYWAGFKSYIESAGPEASEGLVFPEIHIDAPAMKAGFHEKYGDSYLISAMTIACYSGTFAVAHALRECQGVRGNNRPIAECLLTRNNVELPDGPLAVKDRIEQFSIDLKRIVAGRSVKVAP